MDSLNNGPLLIVVMKKGRNVGLDPSKFSQSFQQKVRNAENQARLIRIRTTKPKQVPVQALVHTPKGEVAPVVNPARRYLVTIKMYRERLIKDDENFPYACKEIFDGLVYYKLIPDDSREVIDRDIQQFKVKRKEQRTEITIEEI